MAGPPILIVDDDRDTLEMLNVILTSHDYPVIEAVNGEEGLAAARRHRPELIVLDLMMSVMDGFRVLHELSKDDELQRIPVLVCSGHPQAVRRAVRAGASDCISKPFLVEEFEEKVRQLYRAG